MFSVSVLSMLITTRHVKFREKIITTFLGPLFLYESSLLTVTYSGRNLFLQWESLVQYIYLLVESTNKRKLTNFYILLYSENLLSFLCRQEHLQEMLCHYFFPGLNRFIWRAVKIQASVNTFDT
jgi:hypothetical protein